MNGSPGVLRAIVVTVLVGVLVGLVTAILVWIKDFKLPVSERIAGVIVRPAPQPSLLTLAVFAAAGVLR